MNPLQFHAQERRMIGHQMRNLRKQGLIPSILYGHGIENKNLMMVNQHFLKLYQQAQEGMLVDLMIDEQDPMKVLISEVQRDPVTEQVIHVDFRHVRMDEKIETEMELHFVGESPAVKEFAGIVVKNMETIKVRCLPVFLATQIEVNLSTLKAFDNAIHVSDLAIPAGIDVLNHGDEVIVLVMHPAEEEVEATKVAESVEAVKVEAKGKEKGEGEGAATSEAKKDTKKKEK